MIKDCNKNNLIIGNFPFFQGHSFESPKLLVIMLNNYLIPLLLSWKNFHIYFTNPIFHFIFHYLYRRYLISIPTKFTKLEYFLFAN